MTVSGLHDGDLIRNLLGTYCERIDAGDFTGVGALFAHGHLADEHGTVLASGAAEVEAFYTSTTRRHGPTPRTKHLVVDTILEIAADHAAARSSYVVLQATDALALQPIIAGRYADEFHRIHGTWWFSERRFFVDLVGDLSHHLPFDL